MDVEVALFDFADLEPPEPEAVYQHVVPEGFSRGYFSPDVLFDAWNLWKSLNGNQGAIPMSRMWHPSWYAPTVTAEHEGALFSAALWGCRHDRGCSCVGGDAHRMICDPCKWQVFGDEPTVVEAWHDHAWPGWRELPAASPATAADVYPPEFQQTGAPIITDRGAFGWRHVPGRSPWGGYDLALQAISLAA